MCLVVKSCPTLYNPLECSPLGSSVYEFFQVKILEWIAKPSFRGSPDPGIKISFPVSPALQVDSLPAECQGMFNSKIPVCCFLSLFSPLFLISPYQGREEQASHSQDGNQRDGVLA